MSIGFIGSRSSQKTIDVFSGGANRNVEISLQNVLNKYDKIKTDLDRLVDQAQFGSYDITSRQHYNAYNKESVNGWAENWYAEYRAVLALRSDALQKKLQAAYNRVLDRSAFAEIKPDQTSVFAPYANRTYKDNSTDIDSLSNKMPISSVLLSDAPLVSTPVTPPVTNYVVKWSIADVNTYLGVTSGSGTFPGGGGSDGREALTGYSTSERTNLTPYHGYSQATSGLADFSGWINAPAGPAGPPSATTINTRDAQRASTASAIFDALATFDPPPLIPPKTQADLDAYNQNKDDAVEAGLQVADQLWKGGISADYDDAGNLLSFNDDDGDGNIDDMRDFLPPSQFYDAVYEAVRRMNYDPNAGNITGGSTSTPARDNYTGAYDDPTSSYLGTSAGNFRQNVPMFGAGDIQGIIQQNVAFLPSGVFDTIDADTLLYITDQVNLAIQSFTGMQYDNIYKGNQYDAKTSASSIGIYPYGAFSSTTTFDMNQTVDENYPGGSIISAGSTGSTEVGIKNQPLFNIVIPITPPGIGIYLAAEYSAGVDLYYGHESAISNLSSKADIGASNLFSLPTIGLGSASFSVGIGAPVNGPNGGVVINTSFSYDLFADIFKQIMQQLKKLMVESMTVNSYATSSGTALDSYASRAEYHFTRPGFKESVKALNVDINIPMIGDIPLPIGDLLNTMLFNGGGPIGDIFGFGGLDSSDLDATTVNQTPVEDRLFEYKHGVQGAESRETETGAFFATNAFLSQFELSDMESEYWIGTQQNEELVDQDLGRSLLTAGPELMKAVIGTVASVIPKTGSSAADAAISAILSGGQDKALMETMYDLLYRDQHGTGSSREAGNAVGQIGPSLGGIGANPRVSMQKSSFASEAYDYIESDHKPFEGDSDFNYKQSGIIEDIPVVGPILDNLISDVFTAYSPDFILEGLSNTMRFTNTTMDNDIRISDIEAAAGNQNNATGLGPRGQAGRGSGQYSSSNKNPDGTIWIDTPVGDINEVYSATRKVRFQDLSMGFDEFAELDILAGAANLQPTSPDQYWDGAKDSNGNYVNGVLRDTATAASNLGAKRLTAADVNRYVGADTRVNERRYDGANPVQHESFTSNMYTGGASKSQYDRRNQYSLSFQTKADKGNEFSLFGSQALNPTIGGFIKMATIDKNYDDKVLIEHNNGGMAAVRALGSAAVSSGTGSDGVVATDVQKFGGTADGELNELNQLLYEHLHLRADGKNLSTVKEYRDVFETGLMKSIFISGQSYHPSGGGITSSIEIRYDSSIGRSEVQGAKVNEMTNNAKKTREYYDATRNDFDPYNTPFLTKSSGQAAIYLNTYFAYKKRASNNKT